MLTNEGSVSPTSLCIFFLVSAISVLMSRWMRCKDDRENLQVYSKEALQLRCTDLTNASGNGFPERAILAFENGFLDYGRINSTFASTGHSICTQHGQFFRNRFNLQQNKTIMAYPARMIPAVSALHTPVCPDLPLRVYSFGYLERQWNAPVVFQPSNSWSSSLFTNHHALQSSKNPNIRISFRFSRRFILMVGILLISQKIGIVGAFKFQKLPCSPALHHTRHLSPRVHRRRLEQAKKYLSLPGLRKGQGDAEKSTSLNIPSALKSAWDYLQHRQQYTIVLVLYFFHLTVLTQKEVVFPVQLIPSDKGHFTGIGWDSLAGMLTVCIYQFFRKTRGRLPSILASPRPSEKPWHLPRDNPRFRLTSLITTVVLIQAYFATGRFSIFWEDTLYALSGLGFPITAPMQRSLCVLLGHLSWLALGALLLRWLPRPPKFFQPTNHHQQDDDQDGDTVGSKPNFWFRSSRQSKWLWWVIGGYFVSSWLFNIADLTNQYILPELVLEDAQESVVSQLVSPEHNDWLASVVGYIAPCITAPWWEEILYRGFALAGLTELFGYRWAVFLQGVIFSAHHMSLSAALPLAVLGWTWAVLYTKSRNLWVVVAVHSLWNSRVFLGSWLGL